MTDIDLSDVSDLAAERDGAGPWLLPPSLWVAGIGPEPESAKDAWGRIELFFATHLN